MDETIIKNSADGTTSSLSGGASINGNDARQPPRLRAGSNSSSPIMSSRKQELVSTPRGSRSHLPLFPVSAPEAKKRAQNFPPSYGSLRRQQLQYAGLDATMKLPESAEKRHARLNAELNLATPTIRTKSLTGVPVPKAWSSLVLQAGDEGATSPPANSFPVMRSDTVPLSAIALNAAREPRDSETRRLEAIRKENDELRQNFEKLQLENAKLRLLVPGVDHSLAARLPISPRPTEDFPFVGKPLELSDPDSEIILQAEGKDGDDATTQKIKEVTRQLRTVNVMMKSMETILQQDEKTIEELNGLALDLRRRLEAEEQRSATLENELRSLRKGASLPQIDQRDKSIEFASEAFASDHVDDQKGVVENKDQV